MVFFFFRYKKGILRMSFLFIEGILTNKSIGYSPRIRKTQFPRSQRGKRNEIQNCLRKHFSILLSLLNWSIEQTYPYKLYIIEVRETFINQIGMRRREFRCMQMRVTDHERPSQI